jgi:hypothetical protein
MCEIKSYSKVIKCSNPVELLDRLEFKDSKYAKRNNFVYRGQSNACWGLIPSVYRNDCSTSYENSTKGPESSLSAQVNREIALVKAFAQEANRIGLEIPAHLDTLLEVDSPIFENYPEPEVVEFMAFLA